MHTQIVDDLQILGDLLAWNILDGERHEMRVINWKTGITVWVRLSINMLKAKTG